MNYPAFFPFSNSLSSSASLGVAFGRPAFFYMRNAFQGEHLSRRCYPGVNVSHNCDDMIIFPEKKNSTCYQDRLDALEDFQALVRNTSMTYIVHGSLPW